MYSDRYFTLLSSMCMCFGKAVSRNQNMIARIILDSEVPVQLKLSNEDSLLRLSTTSFLTRSNLFALKVRFEINLNRFSAFNLWRIFLFFKINI